MSAELPVAPAIEFNPDSIQPSLDSAGLEPAHLFFLIGAVHFLGRGDRVLCFMEISGKWREIREQPYRLLAPATWDSPWGSDQSPWQSKEFAFDATSDILDALQVPSLKLSCLVPFTMCEAESNELASERRALRTAIGVLDELRETLRLRKGSLSWIDRKCPQSFAYLVGRNTKKIREFREDENHLSAVSRTSDLLMKDFEDREGAFIERTFDLMNADGYEAIVLQSLYYSHAKIVLLARQVGELVSQTHLVLGSATGLEFFELKFRFPFSIALSSYESFAVVAYAEELRIAFCQLSHCMESFGMSRAELPDASKIGGNFVARAGLIDLISDFFDGPNITSVIQLISYANLERNLTKFSSRLTPVLGQINRSWFEVRGAVAEFCHEYVSGR